MTGAPIRIGRRLSDESALLRLYGAGDENLDRLEHVLGVEIFSRGDQLDVLGDRDRVNLAWSAIDLLQARARAGEHLIPADVDAAVRMCGEDHLPVLSIRTRKGEIRPRSPGQARYIQAMKDAELVFGLGPAGTGKTYLAVAMGVSLFLSRKVERLVLSRPAVEAGERIGFLPGDMREKVDPYLRPMYDALHATLPGEEVVRKLESGEFEVAPLAFMRGRTLSNAFIILDEAQNTTASQMKMFLTRLGENSRMVITGDPSQIDLPGGVKSGLRDALDVLKDEDAIRTIHFTDRDVVRHDLVARIVRAYDRRDADKEKIPNAG
ncbi:PhoH family protein [Phaeovibrio sulfidiphilus]|uniref:PhoH-like protein n=1 Tax=Phaeovibrio sulfidiphilus TaxID=1220600 RepID=A0A8J6YQP0_9PROT|nr:PhoH family protein [Phaeovibrio sulfidiphilus]MBE1237976.1 PhoH family protein [Phaeovibrio sulfidiphilus]